MVRVKSKQNLVTIIIQYVTIKNVYIIISKHSNHLEFMLQTITSLKILALKFTCIVTTIPVQASGTECVK